MHSGLDQHSIDTSVRPQDDLFGFTNGGWLARVEIPADRGRFGTFDQLRDAAEASVRSILEEVSADPVSHGDTGRKVGDLYASFLDEEAVDAAGLAPVAELLSSAASVSDGRDVMALLGRLLRHGVSGVIHPYVSGDAKRSTETIVYLEQGGISLPDESYYHGDTHEAVRAAYPSHCERMLTYAGHPDPAAAATRVVELETRLAGGHWDVVATRDSVKTYTRVDLDGLEQMGPGIAWAEYLEAAGCPSAFDGGVVVREPDFIGHLATALREAPIEQWRDWLRWKVFHDLAGYLPQQVSAESFDFFGRTISGVPEQRARWKRAVGFTEEAMGEAVGQLYVERHFPPRAKERMVELVDNLVAAFRQSFEGLAWMGEETRAQALTKLGAFVAKIGYPDTWRDYSSLAVSRSSLMDNVFAASAFEVDRMFAKLGKPVDRTEWLMTPQTVNAYYHPVLNEIVFPAAILQPPFFDVDADDAVNYGGIGAVIGHEIGHGFDDQGSQFDSVGELRNWWTDEDRARFMERAQALITQFSAMSTRDAPEAKVNGALTIGENIGDLGGLTIGHAAYRISLDGQAAPVLDGFTGDQRFFLGWAQIWRGRSRPEEAKRLLAVDPHSPIDLRANAARNLDEFHAAFDVQPGDGMWVEPQERVRIF